MSEEKLGLLKDLLELQFEKALELKETKDPLESVRGRGMAAVVVEIQDFLNEKRHIISVV
jgi:hypothetical protein